MFKTIRSKILIAIVFAIVVASAVFIIVTFRAFQSEIKLQHQRLARETLSSAMRSIDKEYNDLLDYEIDSINIQRSIMEGTGACVLSLVESFYDMKKRGVLSEKEAKERCLKSLEHYRYQGDRFFFVYDMNLTGLSHPDKAMTGKKWAGFENLNKKDALQYVSHKIQQEKRLFTVFMWPRLEDKKVVKQMGCFLYFHEWGWIIGTSYELSHIENVAFEKEQDMLVNLEKTIREMRLNNTGCIFIFNSSGQKLLHTSSLKKVKTGSNDMKINESILKRLKGAALNPGVPILYYCAGDDKNEKLNIAYVDYHKPMDWYVTALIDSRALNEPVRGLVEKQIMILLGVFLVGILLAYFTSKWIATPLSLIAAYSRNLPGKDFRQKDNEFIESIKSEYKSGEIKELADAFGYMEKELGQNIINLENYQKNLESLVDMRTMELTRANESLKEEIAERKEAEERLKASENRFRSIIEDVSEISIQGYDKDHRAIFWNQASEELYGYSAEEAIGKKLEELIIPESLIEEIKESFDKRMQTGRRIAAREFDLVDKNGNAVPVFSSHVILGTPKGNEMYCIDIDLKPIRAAEEALRESEKKYRHLFTNAPAGMYEIDFMNNKFISVNEVMCEYSGYSEEEFLAMNPLDLLTEESKNLFLERLDRFIKGEGETDNVEYEVLAKDGNHICVLLTNDYIYDGDQITGARVVAHNITDRKKAEEEKMLAQKIAGEHEKLALVGQIAGKMAHDFNNVLGVIMGNTELSLLDCREAETRKTLELILEQTLRGKNLTKNLVAFAKDQEPKQEFFKISEKIDLVLNLLKKDIDGIELIKENKPGVPELLADPGMIEHALVNMIYNSVHALSMIEEPVLIIRTYNDNENIFFEIEDNGCGIQEEYLENIFEPSFTLKGTNDVTGSYARSIKGTGYGMSNVKKYIEQHNGSINVKSEFGRGTKFIISMPVIEKELTKEEKIKIQEGIIHTGSSILLVEDEMAISAIQYRALTEEPCNHKVDIAINGQVAMDLFERNHYDIVSLDYVLLGDINGFTVYNHIRKIDKDIPILFISGNIEFIESLKDLRTKDGNIHHLSKPCQNRDYVSKINELIAESRKH